MKQFIDSEHVHRLTHTYKSPEDVDTYIAMSMERPVSGTLLGPTTKCLIQQQFKALQMGKMIRDLLICGNPNSRFVFSGTKLSILGRKLLIRGGFFFGKKAKKFEEKTR